MNATRNEPSGGRCSIGSSAAIAATCLILYFVYLGYNLGYFYKIGAAVYDAGWFAWLMRNGDYWPLANPAVIGGNFFAAHVSPIFLLTSFLSKLAPSMPAALWFSAIFSLWPPLLAFSIFHLLGRHLAGTIRRTGCTLLLALSGLSLSMFAFPHVESFIEPLLLLTLVLLRGGRLRLYFAVLCFGAMLSIREDAGLHAFLVLAALSFLSWRKFRQVPVRLAAFAAGGAAYSAAAFAIQAKLIPQGGHALNQIYLGAIPFAHLTGSLLLTRAAFWALARFYIFVPLALLLIAACKQRDLALLLGFAIAVPWLALSFIAIWPFAGNLWGYYCFPLTIPCLWPMLLLGFGLAGDKPCWWLRLQLAMGISSSAAFVLLGLLPGIGNGTLHDRAPWRYLVPPSIAKIRCTQAALAELRNDKVFRNAIVDDGVGSLMLGSLAPGQYENFLRFTPAELARATAFIRFTRPPENLETRAAAIGRIFPACTALAGTPIEICHK